MFHSLRPPTKLPNLTGWECERVGSPPPAWVFGSKKLSSMKLLTNVVDYLAHQGHDFTNVLFGTLSTARRVPSGPILLGRRKTPLPQISPKRGNTQQNI